MMTCVVCANCGEDPHEPSRGKLINRRATVGSRIVVLRDQIPMLEKASRRTPPKTLLVEREKVKQAQINLMRAKEELTELEIEYAELLEKLNVGG